jgi:hypothetical protein
MKEEREKKLPKWAQKKLDEMRHRIEDLERMREANSVLSNREWFTIQGPGLNDADKPWDERKLFFLHENGAQPVCSLYYKDILLVGRNLDRHPTAKMAL